MDPKKENTIIKVNVGGPLEISGDFYIIDSSGNKRSLGNKIFLCRCGKSGNKPFCDGSHKKY